MLTILIDGFVYASWLFVISVGLTLVFGVARVLNVAHGSLYAFGAYVFATMAGAWFNRGGTELLGFLLIPAAALAVGIVGGVALERGLRWFHGRDEVAIALATFAVFLILEDVILLIWGVDAFPAYHLYGTLGTTSIGGLTFNNYDLSINVLAAVASLGLWYLMTRTQWGKLVTVVVHDHEAAASFGIDTAKVYPAIFVLGASLGALGGAFSAPMVSVAPGIAVDVVILCFAVVVIGGLGSVPGALVGAIIVGLVRAASIHLFPQVELFVIYAVMTLVLLFRPQGLFALPDARKI